MLDPTNVPPIDSQEMTARFIVARNHINKQKGTVKADAFVPHPYEELSIMRLIQATDDEIWNVGRAIAAGHDPPKTLRGRGDALVATYLSQKLNVAPDSVYGNSNHALATGWPPADDKQRQLLIAKEIAAVARFVPVPVL